ncbi:MAG: hypothetical protein RKO68_01170 [Candidatus Accumulibacter sp.]|nr:hypothetical protein [Accumulibacter sp.]
MTLPAPPTRLCLITFVIGLHLLQYTHAQPGPAPSTAATKTTDRKAQPSGRAAMIGQIVDGDERPAVTIQLRLAMYDAAEQKITWNTSLPSTKASKSGRFELRNIHPGTYAILVGPYGVPITKRPDQLIVPASAQGEEILVIKVSSDARTLDLGKIFDFRVER